MPNPEQIFVFLPELIILSHLLFLCFRTFFSKKSTSFATHKNITSATAALMLALLSCFLYYEEGFFWGGLVISSATTLTLQTALLLCCLLFLLSALIRTTTRHLFSFEYLALIELSLIGGLVALKAHSFLLLFTALELQILPLYLMVAMPKTDQNAGEGSLKYFILGGLSTSCFLFGVSLLYGATGTCHFVETTQWILEHVQSSSDFLKESPLFFLGLAFILTTFGFKLSLVPFHNWTPDVYEGAKTETTCFLATVSKVVAVGVMVRLLSDVFLPILDIFQNILSILGILSMFVGALGALQQTNIKRILAYSTITHIGYIVCAAATGTEGSFQSVVLYLFCYIPVVLLTFALLLHTHLNSNNSALTLNQLKGLHIKHPGLAALFAAAMFALAGLPPFPVFFGKVFLFVALIDQNLWFSACSLILSSLIACYYYLRIIKMLYFEEAETKIALSTT